METVCPHCGKRYKVGDQAVGKQARCANPNCKQTFTVGPAAQPPQGQQGLPITPTPGMPVGAPAPGMPPIPGTGVPMGTPLATPAGYQASPLDDLLSAELGGAAAAMPGMPGVAAVPLAAPAPGVAMPGVGTPVGTPLGAAYRRRKSWKQPAIIAGAIGGGVLLVVAIVLVAVFAGGGGGGSGAGVSAIPTGEGGTASNGLPAWAAFCVPPEATAVGYGNVDKFRQSEVLKMIERFAKERGGAKLPPGLNMQAEMMPFKDAFFALKGSKGVGVLRTRDDLSLETIGLKLMGTAGAAGGQTPAVQTHAGTSYVRAGNGWVAKLSSCTYCMTEQEEDLKEALGRFQRQEAPPLGSDLQEALKNTPRGDHFFAMVLTPGSLPMMPMPGARGLDSKVRWFAVAGQLDSSIRAEAVIHFTAAADATKVKGEFDGAAAKMDQEMGKMPPQFRDIVQKIANLLRGVRMSQSGNRLNVNVNWSVKDIEEIAKMGSGMMPGMPAMPRRGFPGAGPSPF